MKRIKKLASLMLAAVMVLAMGITAFAAESTVDITVDTTDPEGTQSNERTYNYYKIFDASLVEANDASKGVSYYLVSPTNDEQKAALENIVIDEKAVFSFNKSADQTRWIVNINSKSDDNSDGIDFSESETGKANSSKLADELQSMVDSNPTLFQKSDDFDAGEAQTVTPGYYLITSSLGTKMMLDTFVTQSITEKNEYPSNTKTEDKETAEIGEEVTYTVDVVIPTTVAEKDIVVVDTISKGLTMNTAITVAGDKNTGNTINSLVFAENTSYVATNGEKQYKATIPAATVKANAGNTLTLTYKATVNSNAVVNVPETNKAHIEYDNFVSKDIEVKVVTYGFTIKKIDGKDVTTDTTDEQKEALPVLNGAEFTLWDASTGGNEIKVVALDASGNVISADDTITTVAKYRVAENDTEKAQAVKIKAGVATIEGLRNKDLDTDGNAIPTDGDKKYYLQEEKAPEGYNMLTDRVEVQANSTTSIAGTDFFVENKTGSLLPSTGGIGTTIFYVVGGILVIGAGILLVAKKRMGTRK